MHHGSYAGKWLHSSMAFSWHGMRVSMPRSCTTPDDQLLLPLPFALFLPLGYLELRPNASAPSYPASYRSMPDVETALAAFQVWHRRKYR